MVYKADLHNAINNREARSRCNDRKSHRTLRNDACKPADAKPVESLVDPHKDDAIYCIYPPLGGWYTPSKDRPTGIYIHQIIFHEGYRTPGMKAVDVHIMARSHNHENQLVQGRDEIISIAGSTGKVYSMIRTKRTGVNGNIISDDYQEQEIKQYQDISLKEKEIISIVVCRDGKEITVKPDKDTFVGTTYLPKDDKTATKESTTKFVEYKFKRRPGQKNDQGVTFI